MDLLSYGDSIPEGIYRLHSAFENAINFRKGGVIVSLVPPRAGSGPTNVVLKHLPAGARRFRASRFYFYIDENRLRKSSDLLYTSAMPKFKADPGIIRGNLEGLTAVLAARAPKKSLCFIFSPEREKEFETVFEKRMLARMKKAMAFFRSGDYVRGAKTIRGLGFGLTPSGDDFLCGLLTGFNCASANFYFDAARRLDEIYGRVENKNIISSAYLKAAYEGRVSAKTGRLIRALALTGKTELETAARAVLKNGHTSGADFCAGLVFALQDAIRDI